MVAALASSGSSSKKQRAALSDWVEQIGDSVEELKKTLRLIEASNREGECDKEGVRWWASLHDDGKRQTAVNGGRRPRMGSVSVRSGLRKWRR
ncbi:hypothetical protein L484_023268 [Morus notabilis]|uniref:Uncharacterized protein n=1 Tax=Morus notabilis TaxID=981085 RepID=W9RYY4_9ROSA|nr:hypothetical protein L484_023268 [Morus notabilis]